MCFLVWNILEDPFVTCGCSGGDKLLLRWMIRIWITRSTRPACAANMFALVNGVCEMFS